MNPNYTEFKFPQIKAHPWHKVLKFFQNFVHYMFPVLPFQQFTNLTVHTSMISDIPQENASRSRRSRFKTTSVLSEPSKHSGKLKDSKMSVVNT